MILSSLTNITLKQFPKNESKDQEQETNRSKHLIASNTQTKLNEFISNASSKLKSTFNLTSSFSNKNMFYNNSMMMANHNKNHLSSVVNNINKTVSNKTPSKHETTSQANIKFKDGKIMKRTKTDKSKYKFTNTNLLQCFNLTEKERFRELLAQNVPNEFKQSKFNSGILFQANSSTSTGNLYQNFIRSSPTKIRDDNLMFDKKVNNNYIFPTKNEYLIDSTLPNNQPNTSTAAKISAGYSRRISISTSITQPSSMITKAAPILQSTIIPSLPTHNKYNLKNKSIPIIDLDSTPGQNRILPKNNNLSTIKVAKKRQTEIVLDNEDDDIIELENLKNDVIPISHNQNLSANYSLISKNSKLDVNNVTYFENQRNWNEKLSKNRVLQEILFTSQARELAIEEDRYKFKKRQKLEREKIERELAEKFSQQLHLDANNLALLKDEDVIEIIEEDEFPDLSEEQESLITSALNPSPQDEVLVEGYSVKLTRHDIQTLRGLNWLNDEIINFYLSLICDRSKQPIESNNNNDYLKTYAFSTFFYPKLIKDGYSSLKRWTRKVDLFSFELILVPIHLGLHWTLAAIDMNCKEIRYYDSMNGNNHECLRSLRNYLKEEYADKKSGAQLDVTEWNCLHVKDVPQQMNGSDCGMFTCKYAEYISRGKIEFNFNQSHMPYFRRRMIWEILNKKLM